MFCPQCGKPANENAKFCVFCGAPIENQVTPQPVPEQPKKVGYVSAIVLGAISAFLMFIGFLFIVDETSIMGIVSDNIISCMVVFVGPAFAMSLVAFLRALKAKRAQQTTATQVVFIISTILFALAALFMIILFFLFIFSAVGTYNYYPEYEYEYDYYYDTYL